MCLECDRVFHKAANKRFHIRVPLDVDCCRNSLSSSPIHKHFESSDNIANKIRFLSPMNPHNVSELCCVLLASICAILDDRRVLTLLIICMGPYVRVLTHN